MKKLICLFALVFTFGAFAAIDTVALFPGKSTPVGYAAKVIGVRALSSVADGTAAVKVESSHFTNALDIVETPVTNVSYRIVWSNGTEVVTNVSPRRADFVPLPKARQLISFTTNTAVTVTATTNVVRSLAVSVTNVVDELTCSGGYSLKTPTNKFIVGGDKVFYTGTANGRVEIILER